MPDDATLLLRYANERSDEAFGELVQRHIGLVYHSALRQCGGNEHRAKDVTQTVFIALARKAAEVAAHPSLPGWLHTSTRYAAIQEARSEARRAEREGSLPDVNAFAHVDPSDIDWDRVRPALDETLCELGDSDREAVLLRYFEGHAYADIGARFHVSEDAARMRVDRALDKLRALLSGRGITSTVSALGALLEGQASAAVPVGLASSITSGAITASAPVTTAALFMSITKLQGSLILAAVVAGTGVLVYQHRANVRLEAEVAALQRATSEATQALGAASLANATHAAGTPKAAGGPAQGVQATTAQGASLSQGMVPTTSLGNRGRATPRDAFSTQIWAARTGDVELEASTLMLSPESRAKLVALAASLPSDVQAQYDTPEKLLAFALAGSPHPVGGIQVLGESSDGPADATLQVQWQHTDDSVVHTSEAQLHLVDGSWEWEVPDSIVSRAAAYLARNAQPASGGK